MHIPTYTSNKRKRLFRAVTEMMYTVSTQYIYFNISISSVHKYAKK